MSLIGCWCCFSPGPLWDAHIGDNCGSWATFTGTASASALGQDCPVRTGTLQWHLVQCWTDNSEKVVKLLLIKVLFQQTSESSTSYPTVSTAPQLDHSEEKCRRAVKTVKYETKPTLVCWKRTPTRKTKWTFLDKPNYWLLITPLKSNLVTSVMSLMLLCPLRFALDDLPYSRSSSSLLSSFTWSVTFCWRFVCSSFS